MQHITKISLDLDGVLVNLRRTLAEHLGLETPCGVFDNMNFEEGFGVDFKIDVEPHFSNHCFWEEAYKFWWSDCLVDLVDRLTNGNWVFLTKFSGEPNTASGKTAFVLKHWPKHIKKLVLTSGDKSMCCQGSDDLLIDDYEKNIIKWKSQGGQAFRWIELSDDYRYDIVRRFNQIKQLKYKTHGQKV